MSRESNLEFIHSPCTSEGMLALRRDSAETELSRALIEASCLLSSVCKHLSWLAWGIRTEVVVHRGRTLGDASIAWFVTHQIQEQRRADSRSIVGLQMSSQSSRFKPYAFFLACASSSRSFSTSLSRKYGLRPRIPSFVTIRYVLPA